MLRTIPKIAYLCASDPRDGWSHSGGNSRIYKALERHVGEVTLLGRHWLNMEPLHVALERLPEALRIRSTWRAHILLSRVIARGIARELQAQRYDVLFCAYSFYSLLNLKLPYPMLTAFASDATHTIYRDSEIGAAFGSSRTARWFDPLVLRAERKVFGDTDLLLWPSDWLKRRADALYDLDPERSFLVPWGANIEPPNRDALLPDLPLERTIRLLLIGRDWVAKGGPLALETLRRLREQDLDAHLTVVGCVPSAVCPREAVTFHPRLDMHDPEQREVLGSLLASSHFMLMPSHESYGFAFCDASAYGLPSLCLNVGGVPISEGVNGHALPAGSSAVDFAERIRFYRDHPDAYRDLRLRSRAFFESSLNWESWGRSVGRLIDQRMGDFVARG